MKAKQLRSTFFLAILVGVLVLVLLIFQPFLIMLSIAATMAVVLYPAYQKLLSVFRGHAIPAALSMVMLTILLLLVPLVLVGVQVAVDATNLYTQISQSGTPMFADLLQSLESYMQQYGQNISLDVSQYAGQALKWIASSAQSVFASTLQTILYVLLGVIAYYYLLKDGKQFIAVCVELSPLTKKENLSILNRLRKAVNSVIRGSLIIAVLQGIVTGIGLALFGVPSAVLLGSIAGIGALIPTVGTTIVLAPVIFYSLITGDYVQGVGLLVWGAVAVGMIDNFLHPILVGQGMSMHPLFIFFAVIGGISLFGISGFILGPLVMSLFFGLLDIYKAELQRK